MNFELDAHWTRFIADSVDSGRYPSPTDVVREALSLLQQHQQQLDLLRAEIDKGLDDLDRGDYIELDEAGLRDYLTDVGRRGRERLERKNPDVVS
jgi:antitoxin ParD1/3/4